jgi:hypothetical protein
MIKTPMDLSLDSVDWKPATPDVRPTRDMATIKGGSVEVLPSVTHEGVWHFMNNELRVYRLDNGTTVFHADDFERVFGELLK